MKKIIGGKRYDTETAKLIGTGDNGYPCNDFHWFEESLYLKRTGEFFLHGEGGPLSKYVRSVGNTSYGDEKIVPITLDEAKEWVEKYLDAAVYEELFEVEEENSILYSVNLPASIYEDIKRQAEGKGVTMKDIVVAKLSAK